MNEIIAEKVAIVGSRDFPSELKWMVDEYVAKLPTGTVVVSGGARGPDRWAVEAAANNGLRFEEYLPDAYDENGRYRGHWTLFARNNKVLEASDRVVAFWHKNSSGTKDTIDKARSMNKDVIVFLSSGRQMHFKPKTQAVAPPKQQTLYGSVLNPYMNPRDGETVMQEALRKMKIPKKNEPVRKFTDSNFTFSIHAPARIVVDGLTFPSVASAFLAAQMRNRSERKHFHEILPSIENVTLWAAEYAQDKPGFSSNGVWKSVLTNCMYQKIASDSSAAERLFEMDVDMLPDHLLGEMNYKQTLQWVKDRMSNSPESGIATDLFKDPFVDSITYTERWDDVGSKQAIYIIPYDAHAGTHSVFANFTNLSSEDLDMRRGLVAASIPTSKTEPLLLSLSNDKFVLSVPIGQGDNKLSSVNLFDKFKSVLNGAVNKSSFVITD